MANANCMIYALRLNDIEGLDITEQGLWLFASRAAAEAFAQKYTRDELEDNATLQWSELSTGGRYAEVENVQWLIEFKGIIDG